MPLQFFSAWYVSRMTALANDPNRSDSVAVCERIMPDASLTIRSSRFQPSSLMSPLETSSSEVCETLSNFVQPPFS